ncbi:MAG: beta-ketoacyl synthase N-terminal-like domain-containing protein [Polyangiales bacterium]
MKPLAITGLGSVGPHGTGRASFEAALRDPEAARERAFASAPTVVPVESAVGLRLAEAASFDPSEHLGAKGHRNFDRLTKMMIVAAKVALEDAGLKKDGAFVALGPEVVGVCSATAYGSLDEITELNRVAELEHPRYLNPTRFPNTVINAPAGYVSIWEDLRAPNTTLVDGNAGSLDAVLHASIHLASGRAKAFVVGGGEVLSEPLCLGLRLAGCAEGELAIGEGAAYAVIEPLDAARARGAAPLARVLGYGSAFEAPDDEVALVLGSATAVERAVRDALADAGLSAEAVEGVVSAASGRAIFDEAEREGLARVLGRDVPTFEPKRFVGETFGASGAFGLASAVGWVRGLVEGASAPKVALVLAVGLYGNVSAVVVAAA